MFLQNLTDLHTKIKAENPFAMFFTGDFNAHSSDWWSDGGTNPEGREISSLLDSLNLEQLINEPTNFTPGKNPTCIDLIATDQPNLILEQGTRSSLDPTCHHQIIFCKANLKTPPSKPFDRKIWHYQRANVPAIKRSIANFPWVEQLNLNKDINWQTKLFTGTIMNIMSNFIPNEMKTFSTRDPPWLDKPLKTLLKKKDRLYKNYKKHGYRATDKIRLDNFREECKTRLEESRRIYFKNLGAKANDITTSKKVYWKIINRVLNRCKAPKIPPLLVNNSFIICCKEKASIFNNFFAQQCRPLINGSVLPPLNLLTNSRISSIQIRENDILNLLRNLDKNKASGNDGISSQMLILCDDTIVIPLKIIFDNIINSSVFPDLWKHANVTPVFKKEDKRLIKNYRPISLLPICCKIFEKLVFNQLYSFLTSNNLITRNQSGFRPGDSTLNQLQFLTNEIHNAFDNPKCLEVRAVFLDISKAFDKVWHSGLIHKLKQNGVTGNLLNFFISYLSDRKQRVVINGCSSEFLTIESGVPQGSVLGPLLFLIYINDLEQDIKSNIKFFADDTMLYSIVSDPILSASNLNHDLNLIQNWAYQWKMAFNPDPTKQANEIIFSQKKKLHRHPDLFFNGSLVASVNKQKHLGLILDTTLAFRHHLEEKIGKANKIIGSLNKLSAFMPLNALNQIYKSLVRVNLDYCDMIYHIPHLINGNGIALNELMEKVEKTQYRAALAITGAWKGSNRTKLYEELGWESLTDRRYCKRILHFHKIVINETPSYLTDLLPRRKNNPNTFHDIRCRTGRFKNSFFPDSVKSWNLFISHFDDLPSRAVLKKHLLSFFRPLPKSTFGLYDPVGLRIIFQLRVGLSPLLAHKKNHNFIDTFSDRCSCGTAAETTDHFFNSCPLHYNLRINLESKVDAILFAKNVPNVVDRTSLYLYGNSVLNVSDNREILALSIEFIKQTKRFL